MTQHTKSEHLHILFTYVTFCIFFKCLNHTSRDEMGKSESAPTVMYCILSVITVHAGARSLAARL